MALRLNREIKAYCPDFELIRRILRESGATFIEIKNQVDLYYNLPHIGDEEGTRRLKLRTEDENRQLVYYHDRQENGARTSRFQVWEIEDMQVGEVLDVALGVRATVRKQRELWRKENVIFNLDTVLGIGQIFEAEIQSENGYDLETQLEEYQRRFGPYLGAAINGSNEDLVQAQT